MINLGKKDRKSSSTENSMIKENKEDSFKSVDMGRSMIMEDSVIIVDNTEFRR